MMTASGPDGAGVQHAVRRSGDAGDRVAAGDAKWWTRWKRASTGRLSGDRVSLESGASVCVVASSAGYPASYKTGYPITGLMHAGMVPTVQVFHSGTARLGHQIATNGGRVLCVGAQGDSLREALARAYQAMAEVQFEGMYYRRDIGHRALEPTGKA